MAACTFFGHRDCPDTVKEKLRESLTDLIEHHGVHMFYVGHQGRFDAITRGVLRELKREYPQIDYAVVLAYMPENKKESDLISDAIVPEGLELVHPRYAISWRNNWMLKRSDYVVTYITHDWGGAYRYAQKAMRQSKCVRNMANHAKITEKCGESYRYPF